MVLKDYISEIKEWAAIKIAPWQAKWANLPEREQRILTIGAIIVGLLLIYLLILSPLYGSVADLRERLQKNEKTFLWMQEANKEIQTLEGFKKNKKPLSIVSLLSLLKKKNSEVGLESRLTLLQQSSNDSIEMRYQQVNFNELLKMLLNLIQEQGIVITRFSIIASKTPGLVNAIIVLNIP